MAEPAQVLLSYEMPDDSTGNVYLDASVNENHQANAQVTEHRVESGQNVTDYIRPLPRRLSIEGLVTNTPLSAPKSQANGVTAQVGKFSAPIQTGILEAPFFGGALQVDWQAVSFSTQFDRMRDVYGVLVDAALAGAVFTITTSLATYKNMVIENFASPRSVETANALRFTVDFKEIVVVDTQTVQALPSKVQTKKRGNKAPKAATQTEQQQMKSALLKTANFIGGLFGGGG
jgi:hypothetical protein